MKVAIVNEVRFDSLFLKYWKKLNRDLQTSSTNVSLMQIWVTVVIVTIVIIIISMIVVFFNRFWSDVG